MDKRMNRDSFVGKRLYFVTTGAGSRFQHDLWMVPGASGFLVGAAFPYAKDDIDEFLGFKAEKYCSREQALQLAMEAYMRARRAPSGEAIGLAVTAAVASVDGPPRRGDHRIFVAVVSANGGYVLQRTLEKNPGFGSRQRQSDNDVANLYAEDLLRIVLGEWTLEQAIDANSIGHVAEATIERVKESELLGLFFKHPFFGQGGGRGSQDPATMEVFYPGTFDPLHDGHRHIMHNVGTSNACYVVNVDSVHKPEMSIIQILDIAAQFRTERLEWRNGAVLFTHGEPLFVNKFKKRTEKTFVVGVDTLERMLDPKWGVDPNNVLKSIYDNGVQLYVCDRIVDGVHKKAVEAIKRLVPADRRRIAPQFYPMDVEPSDLSSSEIRATRNGT